MEIRSTTRGPRLSKIDLLVISLLVLCLTSAFLSGFLVHATFFTNHRELPILFQAFSILIDHAYFPLPDTRTLEYGMIRGMLQEYGDPYASFLEPTKNELETDRFEGSFGGIGADILQDSDGNFILKPYPGSPAARAGIQNGDRLIEIDDTVLTKESALETIQASIRGEAGTRVWITIARAPDYNPQRLSIIREEFNIPSIAAWIVPGHPAIGYLKLNVIASSTPQEIEEAFKDLSARGADRFILDIRDNGGGFLTAGIEVARLFLADGEIIRQQSRADEIEIFRVTKPGPLADKRLVVLINHNTASAAEIVAGALQMQGRAVLIGEPSYGKNAIQLAFPLDDGASLHLTSARWWLTDANGNPQKEGLQPDINLPSESYTPEQVLNQAIEIIIRD